MPITGACVATAALVKYQTNPVIITMSFYGVLVFGLTVVVLALEMGAGRVRRRAIGNHAWSHLVVEKGFFVRTYFGSVLALIARLSMKAGGQQMSSSQAVTSFV
jgi:predicted ThiF/HesA family dinucleotide-utilizing enzyme